MDDFSGAIDQLKNMLSTEDGQSQIQNMLGMFLNKSGGDGEQSAREGESHGSGAAENAEMFMKIQRVMSQMSGERSRNAEFLNMLKPYLGESRRDKVDNAVKMMNLAKMAAIFKEMG